MTRLILHIGKEKTGTTYIQKKIAANRSVLSSLGLVDAGKEFGNGDHCWITILGYEEKQNDDVTLNLQINKNSDFLRKLKIQSRQKDLLHFSQNHSGQTLISSSEHMSSRLTSMNQLERLHNALKPAFDEVIVLVYLRDPLESAVSLWSTALKSGSRLKDLPKPCNHYWNNCCNHKRTLQVWAEVFGFDNVYPRVYEFACSHPQGLFGDFMDACNVRFSFSKTSPQGIDKRSNKKLTLPAMRVLGRINEKFLDLNSDFQFRSLRSRVVSMLEEDCGDFQDFLPSSAIAEEYRSAFLESNKWVQRTYFGDCNSLPWGVLKDSSGGSIRESRDVEDELFSKYVGWISARLSEVV